VAASRAPDPSSAATSGDSLRQLAGQRIVFGFQGTHAPRSLLQRIHRREAAGAILFSRNISSRSQLRSLTRALQAARPAGDPPVLVMIDQEGGVVKRLSGAPHHLPAELGKKNDASLARREGRDTARNLRDAGVNVNLAPVLDVGRPGSVMRKLGRSSRATPRASRGSAAPSRTGSPMDTSRGPASTSRASARRVTTRIARSTASACRRARSATPTRRRSARSPETAYR